MNLWFTLNGGNVKILGWEWSITALTPARKLATLLPILGEGNYRQYLRLFFRAGHGGHRGFELG
jgi:hypothetical protein